jgi:hypothetical protein
MLWYRPVLKQHINDVSLAWIKRFFDLEYLFSLLLPL